MQSFISDIKFRIAFGAFWFSWAELQAIVLHRFGLSFQTSILDSLISNGLLGACCLLIGMNMKYYLPKKEKYWYLLIVSTALSLLWLFTSKFCLSIAIKNNVVYDQILQQSLLIRFSVCVPCNQLHGDDKHGLVHTT